MPIPERARLLYIAEECRGRAAEVQVKSLLLMLFANGIGILSVGIEAFGVTLRDALWINESMRKVYLLSGRQVTESKPSSSVTAE